LKLETLMENAVDKNFDKLEIWTLRNVFALGRGKGGDEGLGEWVRLGHYEVCVLTATLSLRGTKREEGSWERTNKKNRISNPRPKIRNSLPKPSTLSAVN
jgi:hypothetical protein